MDPYWFIVFQHRVLHRRTVREIGGFPLLPGREGIVKICYELSREFPMFKAQLLYRFDGEGDAEADKRKRPAYDGKGKRPAKRSSN